jgi:hypothetical protein
MSPHPVCRLPKSTVAPVAGVAEVWLAGPVGGSGIHGSASSAEAVGYSLDFFPSLVDPTRPIILGTLRGEGPAAVVKPSHATNSWPAIVAEAGERTSYGSVVGARPATAVVVPGYTAAGNPCLRLTLAFDLVGNSHEPAVRPLNGESVDSCSWARWLDRLYSPVAFDPQVFSYTGFRLLNWSDMRSQVLAEVPRGCSGH